MSIPSSSAATAGLGGWDVYLALSDDAAVEMLHLIRTQAGGDDLLLREVRDALVEALSHRPPRQDASAALSSGSP